MKPQFSSVPREVDKFISWIHKVNFPPIFGETVQALQTQVLPKLREAVHFELPPRRISDFGGHYTAEDILAVCEPELKMPYPTISIYRVIDEVPVFMVAWTKKMWIEKKEAIGDIIHFHALRKHENKWWYPAHAVLRLEPDNVLDASYLRDNTFAMWHTYGWCNSAVPKTSDGRLEDIWSEETTRDVVELCALLKKPSTRLETQKDSRLKAKLGSSKKTPKIFYDVHRVVIDNTAPNPTTPAEYKGGTHASPRWHKRRGYWRTMKKSGKTVWVNACEVGKKSDGMVYKDYEVKIGD